MGLPIDSTAVANPDDRSRLDGHVRVGERRAADLTALGGAVLWVAAVLAARAGTLALTTVELFVCLATLVIVPLGLGVAATPRRSGGASRLYTLAVAGQLPAAVAVVFALSLPVGSVDRLGSLGGAVFALPWLGVAGTVALFGLWRLAARGFRPRPLPELAVDAALLYLPVGAVALVLHRAGISFHFDPVIILLTVVHYHYAGFALPLVTGLVGRRIADGDRFGETTAGRVAAVSTVVIVVNLALIAVGITFSPAVEVAAVSLFTVAVAGFAALTLWRVVPAVPPASATGLAVASMSLLLTMALAFAYGYSAFPTTGRLIGIDQMVRWHGTVNAFGFAIPALLALRHLDR